jgi:hypothetical protein
MLLVKRFDTSFLGFYSSFNFYFIFVYIKIDVKHKCLLNLFSHIKNSSENISYIFLQNRS